MSGSFTFDHAVIIVHDLETAIANYKALGFTTINGGEHADGRSHNALIVFMDGSYLELFAPTRRRTMRWLSLLGKVNLLDGFLSGYPAIATRFMRNVAIGEGLADYALLSQNIQKDSDSVRNRGLHVDGPFPGGRSLPDGRKLAWNFALPTGDGLPFLLADETIRPLRVPDIVENTTHENGVTGVAGVVVAVRNIDEHLRQYTALLGVGPSDVGSPIPDVRIADFTLDNTTVTLMQPTGIEGLLREHLSYRGESPYALRLHTGVSGQVKLLDLEQTHGARLELCGTGNCP